MKKALIMSAIVVLATVIGLIMACSPAAKTSTAPAKPAEKAAPILIKWGSTQTTDHPQSVIFNEFADKVGKETEGRIKIEFYPASALGNDAEMFDMLRSGTIGGMIFGTNNLQSFIDEIQGVLLPYTFDNADQMTRFFNDYLKDNVFNKDLLAKTGVRVLGCTNFGMRHLTTKGIKVKTPADLAGKKIRAPDQPVSLSYAYTFGGVPVPVSYSELYMALQTGVVVAQENPIANIYSVKLYEVQNYLVLTAHIGAVTMFGINEKLWQSLSKNDQEIISKLAIQNNKDATDKMKEREDGLIKELQAKGMTVLTQKDFDIEAFKTNAKKVVKERFSGEKFQAWMKMYQLAREWVTKNS